MARKHEQKKQPMAHRRENRRERQVADRREDRRELSRDDRNVHAIRNDINKDATRFANKPAYAMARAQEDQYLRAEGKIQHLKNDLRRRDQIKGNLGDRAMDQMQLRNLKAFAASDRQHMQYEASKYGKAYKEGAEDEKELATGYAQVDADKRDMTRDKSGWHPVRY